MCEDEWRDVRTGHRQVVEEGHTDPDWHPDLGNARDTSHLSPDLEGPSTGTAMIRGVGVGRTAEEIGNLIVGREEALHDALPSAGQLMAIRCSVDVQSSLGAEWAKFQEIR